MPCDDPVTSARRPERSNIPPLISSAREQRQAAVDP